MFGMQAEDDPRSLKGIQEFHDGLFFECHETLEEIWLEDHGGDRKFYQGIIQIAAGYYKLEQGVPAGALKLWRMGVEKLVPYSPAHLGISVDALIQAVEENLSALAANETSEGNPAIQPPSIHFICRPSIDDPLRRRLQNLSPRRQRYHGARGYFLGYCQRCVCSDYGTERVR